MERPARPGLMAAKMFKDNKNHHFTMNPKKRLKHGQIYQNLNIYSVSATGDLKTILVWEI